MATEDKQVKLEVLKASQDYLDEKISDQKTLFEYNIDSIVGTSSTYTITPKMITGSYAKSTTGIITVGENYKRSDYIPTFGGTTMTLSSGLTSLCFYDENKEYISGTSSSANLTKEIPENAHYWILSLTLVKAIPTITIENASPLYKKNNDETLKREHELVANSIIGTKFPGNMVDPFDKTENAYVSTSNGGIIKNNSYFCTGYIPVVAGTTYKSNYGRTAAWYDSSKQFISGSTNSEIQNGIVAPENAAYIRININKSLEYINDLLPLYFTEIGTYSLRTVIEGLPWCTGKTVNWLGDSITAPTTGFDEMVCDALGLTKLTTDGTEGNGGIGGSTISLKEDGTDDRDAMCVRYADMPNNADIIIVSGGSNDFEYAHCPIGTIESTEPTTFYGALKVLCEGLVAKYPNKLIFFTTPIPRMQPFEEENGGTYTQDYAVTTALSKNKYGKTLLDYADIIKEVCALYSIPVLDMCRESNLNPYNDYRRYLADASASICFTVETKTVGSNSFIHLTHPNTLGRKLMARRVSGWITQLGYDIADL